MNEEQTQAMMLAAIIEIRDMLRTLTARDGSRIVRRFGPGQELLWTEREESAPPRIVHRQV